MNDQTILETLSLTNGDSMEGFSFHRIDKTDCMTIRPDSFHQILFLSEGKIKLEDGENTVLLISAGECMMISQYKEIKITARRHTDFILFSFKSLLNQEDKNYFTSLINKTLSLAPASFPSNVRPVLNNFLTLLYTYRFHGLSITPIQDIKHQELFLLFRHYYTERELIALFHPLIYRLTDFRQLIIDNQHSITSVAELISITGLSRTTFERKFREQFGTSAHQWLLKQKAKQVWNSLSDAELSIDEVRKQTGFNSATHFVRFCHQQFGLTPSDIRKQIKKGLSHPSLLMDLPN